MFRIISRYLFCSHPLDPFPLNGQRTKSTPLGFMGSRQATHHGSVVHRDSSNGPCAYCHALGGAAPVIQGEEMDRNGGVIRVWGSDKTCRFFPETQGKVPSWELT